MMSPLNDFITRKNSYRFNSSWKVDAPLKLIWDELINYKKWPDWCGALEGIQPLDQSDSLQKGNNIRSSWRGGLPYTICFDAKVKDFARYSFLSFNVTGDLYGEGSCHFLSSHDNTTINFIWNVSPTKLWMKMSSPFARPVFMENHDQIMDLAVKGFTRMIEQKTGKTFRKPVS